MKLSQTETREVYARLSHLYSGVRVRVFLLEQAGLVHQAKTHRVDGDHLLETLRLFGPVAFLEAESAAKKAIKIAGEPAPAEGSSSC